MIHRIEHHIGKLREKPEHIRKRIAFVTSGAISLIIFLGWIASYGITTTAAPDEAVAVKAPIQSLTASLGDVYQYVKDIFNGSNKTEYSSGDTAPIELIPGKR